MPSEGYGTIIIWYGSLGSIPAGWILCNGENGTPDLEALFVIGAGNSFHPTNSNIVLHSHTATSSGHDHDINPGANPILAGNNRDEFTNDQQMTMTTNTKLFEPPYHALAYIMRKN